MVRASMIFLQRYPYPVIRTQAAGSSWRMRDVATEAMGGGVFEHAPPDPRGRGGAREVGAPGYECEAGRAGALPTRKPPSATKGAATKRVLLVRWLCCRHCPIYEGLPLASMPTPSSLREMFPQRL